MAYLRLEAPYSEAPRPDLILLDVNMPRVDGREVLAAVKAAEDLRAIPIVVFTTSGTPEDIVGIYGAHANAYVTKPIDLADFEGSSPRSANFYGHTVTLPRRGSDTTDQTSNPAT